MSKLERFWIGVGVLVLGAAACGSVTTTPDAALPGDAVDAPPDGPHMWSPFTAINVDYVGVVRTPVTSGDGLTLYFMAQLTGNDPFDIYSASRGSTSESFGTAAALGNVNVLGEQARYPEISEDGLELYYSRGDIGPIMVATRPNTNTVFSVPAPVRTGVSGNFPSLSGNKLSLYYIAQVTQGQIDGALMRITRAAVGEPWSTPAPVTLDGAVQIYSSIDVSSDELSILRAPPLDPLGQNILVSRRTSKTNPFDQTEVLTTVDASASAFASARWRANETEIWVGQPDSTIERPFVSRFQ